MKDASKHHGNTKKLSEAIAEQEDVSCWILQRMSNPEINAVEAEADPDNAASQGAYEVRVPFKWGNWRRRPQIHSLWRK